MLKELKRFGFLLKPDVCRKLDGREGGFEGEVEWEGEEEGGAGGGEQGCGIDPES